MYKNYFITAHSRIEQTDEKGIWRTLDNQLYKDNDGTIYLVPRHFLTDGFTIPNWIAWLAGSKMELDTRASSQHDLEAKYGKVIIVRLTECQLRKMGYLRIHKDKLICDNIPLKFLEIKETTFNEMNNRFKRMLTSVGNISKYKVNLYRLGVNFNIGWLKSKPKLDVNKFYKEEI